MTRCLSSPRFTRSLLTGAVAAASVLAVLAQSASAIVAPSVPPTIAVPAGNELFLVGHATGVQIYSCNATSTSFAWTFVAPQATLFADNGRQIATHYAGPTWQANDGSTVKGKKIGSAPSPNPNSIQQLLLQAVSTMLGPDGGDRLTATTYVQRLNTNGGLAPTSGCAQTSDVGSTFDSPYTADYYFYHPTTA